VLVNNAGGNTNFEPTPDAGPGKQETAGGADDDADSTDGGAGACRAELRRLAASWQGQRRDTLIAATHDKRPGRPDDIAETAHFLASPGARHITGQTIHVNGGAFTTR